MTRNIVLILVLVFLGNNQLFGQFNYVSNGSFEQHTNCTDTGWVSPYISFNDSFNYNNAPANRELMDWVRLAYSPDVFNKATLDSFHNILFKHIQTHRDSNFVGAFIFSLNNPNFSNIRELFQNKLKKPLDSGKAYIFQMWVQIADTLPWPEFSNLAGINKFQAYFSKNEIPYFYLNQNYLQINPQVKINTMVIDTQNWVLLTDTFVAKGGESYMTIGNFNTDAQTQYQIIDSSLNGTIPNAVCSYVFFDDISVFSLDEIMGTETVNSDLSISVFPNPSTNSFSIKVNNAQVIYNLIIYNAMGTEVHKGSFVNNLTINTANWPSGIYTCIIKTNNTKPTIKKISIINN